MDQKGLAPQGSNQPPSDRRIKLDWDARSQKAPTPESAPAEVLGPPVGTAAPDRDEATAELKIKPGWGDEIEAVDGSESVLIPPEGLGSPIVTEAPDEPDSATDIRIKPGWGDEIEAVDGSESVLIPAGGLGSPVELPDLSQQEVERSDKFKNRIYIEALDDYRKIQTEINYKIDSILDEVRQQPDSDREKTITRLNETMRFSIKAIKPRWDMLDRNTQEQLKNIPDNPEVRKIYREGILIETKLWLNHLKTVDSRGSYATRVSESVDGGTKGQPDYEAMVRDRSDLNQALFDYLTWKRGSAWAGSRFPQFGIYEPDEGDQDAKTQLTEMTEVAIEIIESEINQSQQESDQDRAAIERSIKPLSWNDAPEIDLINKISETLMPWAEGSIKTESGYEKWIQQPDMPLILARLYSELYDNHSNHLIEKLKWAANWPPARQANRDIDGLATVVVNQYASRIRATTRTTAHDLDYFHLNLKQATAA